MKRININKILIEKYFLLSIKFNILIKLFELNISNCVKWLYGLKTNKIRRKALYMRIVFIFFFSNISFNKVDSGFLRFAWQLSVLPFNGHLRTRVAIRNPECVNELISWPLVATLRYLKLWYFLGGILSTFRNYCKYLLGGILSMLRKFVGRDGLLTTSSELRWILSDSHGGLTYCYLFLRFQYVQVCLLASWYVPRACRRMLEFSAVGTPSLVLLELQRMLEFRLPPSPGWTNVL